MTLPSWFFPTPRIKKDKQEKDVKIEERGLIFILAAAATVAAPVFAIFAEVASVAIIVSTETK